MPENAGPSERKEAERARRELSRRTFLQGTGAAAATMLARRVAHATTASPPAQSCATRQSRLNVLLDTQGRQIVPTGYEVITDTIDFQRMARMGANFQMLRLMAGRLGGWQGVHRDPAYLDILHDMVMRARDVGIQTMFVLTLYDIKGYEQAAWDQLWENKHGEQEYLLAAWRQVWQRFAHEPAVYGYDLLNEPSRRSGSGYEESQNRDFVPLLRRYIDALQQVSKDKWALCQPMSKDYEDVVYNGVKWYVDMTVPIEREHVIFAPHLYVIEPDKIAAELDSFEQQAALSNAPMLLGEWGPAVYLADDFDVSRQFADAHLYQVTGNEIDARCLGAIKTNFSGSRYEHEAKIPYTWALFSDYSDTGRVERKYIVDPIVRPRPQVIAGRIEKFGFDFATREFELVASTQPASGASVLFVPADRHYPDGYRLQIGDGLKMQYRPEGGPLTVTRAAGDVDRAQAEQIGWDPESRRLHIRRWLTEGTVTVKVLPGEWS